MKRHDDTVMLMLLEPGKGKLHMLLRTVGYFFRCVLAFAFSYGVVRFALDSTEHGDISEYAVVICAFLCALFSVMALHRIFAVGGAVLCVSCGLYILSLGGKISDNVQAMLNAAANSWYRRLSLLGYEDAASSVIEMDDLLYSIGKTEDEVYMTAVFFFAAFICALTVFFTVRRAYIFPPFTVATMLSALILFYGACENNVGFGIMIGAAIAIISLANYDDVFASKRQAREALGADDRSGEAAAEIAGSVRRGADLGGFVGAAVLIVALLFVVIGPMQINTPMKDIPAVSRPAQRIEKYVAALVNGYAPKTLDFFGVFGGSLDGRKTEATIRKPKGADILRVSADTDVPIYLRTWTGMDYIGDSWHTASYERADGFYDIFGENFSSEKLFSELLFKLDASLGEIPEERTTVANIPLGYVTSWVHIEKPPSADGAVVLPDGIRFDCGFFRHGTDEPYNVGCKSRFDSVYSWSGFASPERYTVISDNRLPPSSSFICNISAFVRHYSEQYSIIESAQKMLADGASEADLQSVFSEKAFSRDVISQAHSSLTNAYLYPEAEHTLGWRYVYAADAEERRETDRLVELVERYNDYVYNNYTTGCEDYDRFRTLIASISEGAGINLRRAAATYDGRHRIVEAVTDYLSENMKYTLSPKNRNEELPYYNSAHTFLFDTNEGYCVQYATAAVMLLRAAGIPVRYVEGYIANDFKTVAPGGMAKYECTVRDKDAHAWIEVYYDYFGWVRYEVTAPYSSVPADSLMGNDSEELTETSGSDIDESDNENNAQNDPIVILPPDSAAPQTVPDTNGRGYGVYLMAVVAVIVAVTICAGTMAVIIIASRGRRADRERRELMRRAVSNKLGRGDRLLAAVRMGDIIEKLLSHKSLTPMPGETASIFAMRVDKMLYREVGIRYYEVLCAVQAGEFSNDISNEELSSIAEYLDVLYRTVMHSAGMLEAIRIKYFLLAS